MSKIIKLFIVLIVCFAFNAASADELQPSAVEQHQPVPSVNQNTATYDFGSNKLKIITETYDNFGFFQKIYFNDNLAGFTFLTSNSENPDEYVSTYQNLKVVSYFNGNNLIHQSILFEGNFADMLNQLTAEKNLIFGELNLRSEYEEIVHNQFGVWRHFHRETGFQYPDLDTSVNTSYVMNIASDMVEISISGQLSGDSYEYFDHVRYYYDDTSYPQDKNPPPTEIIQGRSFHVVDYSSFKLYILESGNGWKYDVSYPLIQAISISN